MAEPRKSNSAGEPWTRAHEWAAGALTLFREQLLDPAAGIRGARFMAVLPVPESESEASELIEEAHQALLGQRSRLRSPRWCWVRATPLLFAAGSRAGSGAARDGFLLYPPSNGSLLAQSLGIGVPEPLLGLVILAPMYVAQVEVRSNGRLLPVQVHQMAGPDFPFENPDAIPALCAYARSREGDAGMLGVQVIRGPENSWRLEGQFADLEASARERTGHPPGTPGAHESPAAVLHLMMDPTGVDVALPLEFQVTRFPVAFLLGRMAWQTGCAVLEGVVPVDVLSAMADARFAEDLVDAGWQGVLDDQRGERRYLADLLTDDEAEFLPVGFLPEVAERRTPRSSEAEGAFRQAVELARAAGRDVVADEVSRVMGEVFAAHPHWREER